MAAKAEDTSVTPETFFHGLSRMRVTLSQSAVVFVLSIVLFIAQVFAWPYFAAAITGSLVLVAGEYLTYRYLKEQGLYGSKSADDISTCDSRASVGCDSCRSKGSGCLGLYQDNIAYQVAKKEQKDLVRIFSSPYIVQMAVAIGWCLVQLVAVVKHGTEPWSVGAISFLLSLFGMLGFSIVRILGVRLSKVQFK